MAFLWVLQAVQCLKKKNQKTIAYVFKSYLTPMLACSQKIYDVGMMTKFTKNFKFSSKVSVIIFGGIL